MGNGHTLREANLSCFCLLSENGSTLRGKNSILLEANSFFLE